MNVPTKPLLAASAAVLMVACAAATAPDLSGMSFSSQPLLGKVVWHDLITEDADAARRFYGELFGWEFEDTTGANGQDYVLARQGDVYVAGLVQVASPRDGTHLSRWLPYVSVADVDEAVSRGVAAGAEVAASARDLNLGRVAAIVDPEGAVIGLARSRIGDPDDRTTAPELGRPVWSELLANDPSAAAEFYRTVIGYDVRRIERRGGQYMLLAAAGADRAGIFQNPSPKWQPPWLISFGVADPAAAAELATSLGGRVILQPSPDVREGSIAVVTDPAGAVLVLQRWPQ